MSPEELRKMQLIELELLLELDRICRKHDIKYNICGGTLIGAMRHKGFIPWDDDVDVRMIREEYNKFKKICKEELDTEKFFLQDFESDKKYRWGYAKLLKKDTVYIRKDQEKLGIKNGVYMDILISDGIPNNPTLAKIHNGLCFAIRKVLWSPVGFRVKKNTFLKIWYKILSFIPRCVSILGIKILAKLFNFNNCNCLRSITFPQKRGLKKEWFVELEDIEFEGHMVKAPKDAHGWLTQEYGDYMKLPPVEKRVGHSPASYYKF